MRLTELALRRPVTVLMFFSCMIVIGLAGSQRLPLEFLPNIEFPGVFIQLPYRNSSPEEVERSITRPAEEVLATLTGVERMNSESRENGSGLFVQFGWDQDTTIKGIEARDKIEAIRSQLPEELGRVQIFKFNLSDAPIMTVRISASRDLSQAHDMLERNLKRRIERIAGVSRVVLYGVEPKEVRIELSAQRIAAHGVDLGELGERLLGANFALAAGEIEDGGRRYLVRPAARFGSLEDIGDFVINARGLRLRDVASIGYLDPLPTYGRHLNRRYAVGIDVFKETGANMVAVAERVHQEVERIRALPEMAGISLFVMQDQAQDVRESLRELMQSGLLGALLSLIVLYAFLRDWRMTLIVTSAVPISLLMTLGAMYFLGYSLNILSLMGLMLSVGMLVDNGVVVTESIYNERQHQAVGAAQATLRGTRAVGLAVAAGTLTTAIVFLPNIFSVQDDISVFMSHVAITICISLLASLMVALTLIPQLTARLAIRASEKQRAAHPWRAAYAALLRWTLRHGGWSALGLLAIVGSVAVPASLVDFEMFPSQNSRQLFLRYNLNAQYALSEVEAAVNRIEAYLHENEERFGIESVYSYWDIGRAQTTIRLVDKAQRTLSTEAVQKSISEEMPKIPIGMPSFEEQRAGSREALAVRVSGEHTEQLHTTAYEVARVLRSIEGLRDIQVDAASTDHEVRIQVDRDRVQRQGMNSQAVAEIIATAMRGRELRPYQGPQGEIDLLLQFSREDRSELDRLLQLPVRTPAGELIALSSLATISESEVTGTIRRQNRRTALQVKLTLDGIDPQEARKRIRRALDALALPTGTRWDFGEAFDEDAEQAQRMLQNMLLALACIYIVMAALFEAVLAPTAIISGVLFSFIGVFWFFLLTGTTFTFMAMIGLLILMGIVVNNGIVMIDHVSQLRRAGIERDSALVQGAGDRMRPILMTVFTTVLGMVPLSLGEATVGGDGPPYFPMARAIIGGLLFSTLVSLLMLPRIYAWMDDLGHWGRRVFRRARNLPLAAP